MSYFDGTLSVRAFAEQTLFSIANVDFIAGIELDEQLRWQPYSGLNLYLNSIFAQAAWGPRGVSLQVIYQW